MTTHLGMQSGGGKDKPKPSANQESLFSKLYKELQIRQISLADTGAKRIKQVILKEIKRSTETRKRNYHMPGN